MTKPSPCTSDSGRHRWAHTKNATVKRLHAGPHGTAIQFARVGLYRCEICSAEKVGTVRVIP